MLDGGVFKALPPQVRKSSPIQISAFLGGSAGFDINSVPNLPGTEIKEMESTLKVLAVHSPTQVQIYILRTWLECFKESGREKDVLWFTT